MEPTTIEMAQDWAKLHEAHESARFKWLCAEREMNELKRQADVKMHWLRTELSVEDPDQTRVWPFALPSGKVAYVTMQGDKSTVLDPIK